MSMKTALVGLLVTGMIAGTAPLSLAQMVALPLLDTAGNRDEGSLELMPGVSVGDEMNFYGARTTVTAMDDLRCFFDLGRVDTKDDGANLAVQVGGLYNLPLVDGCDTALRGAMYYSNPDPLTIVGGNMMLMGSSETILNDLYLYGGLGLDLSKRKVGTYTTELNPALALGLSYRISDNFVLFLEGDFIDGLYASGGLSIR